MIGVPQLAHAPVEHLPDLLGHAAGTILWLAVHDLPAHDGLLVGANDHGHRTVRTVHPADLPWIERRVTP
jgi:hypothetical protein